MLYKTVIQFPYTIVGPKELSVVDFTFFEDGAYDEGVAELLVDILHFAIVTPTDLGFGAKSIGGFLSPLVSRVIPWSIKVYDAENGGSPKREETFTDLPASATVSALPSEVACVLSFNANLTGLQEQGEEFVENGVTKRRRPKAQRRGRNYWGPFNSSAADEASPGRPSTALRNHLADLGQQLLPGGAIDVLPDTAWVVYSSIAGAHPVVAGHVDDAWDTQRRRGVPKSSQVDFGVGG